METTELIKIGSVLLLGSIIQTSSGFGFGLFAIPILLFLGFDLPATVTMIIVASAISKGMAITSLKRDIRLKDLSPVLKSALIGLPIGIYSMFKISTLDQSFIKQIIGLLILLLLILRWLGKIKPGESVPKAWSLLAGFSCGFLNGLANIGGPPAVLWMLSHNWTNRKSRGTIIALSLIFVPFQLPLLYLAFGTSILTPILKALLLFPTVVVGTWIGLAVGGRISKEHLVRYIEVLLLIIALSAIGRPLLPG